MVMALVETGAVTASSPPTSMEIAEIVRLRHEPVHQVYIDKLQDSHV